MKSKSINPNLNLFPVAAGVWGMKDVFVNVYFILNSEDNSWVLVDAGLKWSAGKIKRAAQLIFGEAAKPSSIVLTHGHFDHIGAVSALSNFWDVPVYAHHLEMPYLTGISAYPPGDPTVSGGLMSDLSFLFSNTPINIESRVVALPADGTVPGLPDWKYLHTPGHSPGHVSLFREKDRVLIAGDAVVTTKAESLWFTALQLRKLSGPPKYFTSDWLSAAASVEELAKLEPAIVAGGHGKPIRGAGLRKSLHNLAEHFDRLAVPFHGRYVYQPALSDDTGVVHLPPKNRRDTSAPTLKFLGVAVAVLITVTLFSKNKKKKKLAREAKEDEKLARKYKKQFEKEAAKKTKSIKDKAPAQNFLSEVNKYKKPVQRKIAEFENSTKKAVKKVPPFVHALESLKFPIRKETKKIMRKLH